MSTFWLMPWTCIRTVWIPYYLVRCFTGFQRLRLINPVTGGKNERRLVHSWRKFNLNPTEAEKKILNHVRLIVWECGYADVIIYRFTWARMEIFIDGMNVFYSTVQTYPFQTENIAVISGTTPHFCSVYDRKHFTLFCSSRKVNDNMSQDGTYRDCQHNWSKQDQHQQERDTRKETMTLDYDLPWKKFLLWVSPSVLRYKIGVINTSLTHNNDAIRSSSEHGWYVTRCHELGRVWHRLPIQWKDSSDSIKFAEEQTGKWPIGTLQNG